ncbi:MAG: hypothetical protein COA65_07205 [Rhodospirillaceae bacterium]|nr:MAG: hypothetical protein COA65_07205 [Rhodospirillaceae bacterium]
MNDPNVSSAEKKPAFAGKKGWVFGGLVLLLAVGGVTAFLFLPALPGAAFLKGLVSSDARNATESLSRRLTVLEEAIAALPKNSENPTSALNAIAVNVASLDARLAALENGIAQGDGADVLTHLVPEIEKLQSEFAALSARMAELAFAPRGMADLSMPGSGMRPYLRAVEDLREGLWEYGPFRDRLAALLAVAGGNPAAVKALAPIATYADQGIPTLPMLRARFDDLAAAVLARPPVTTGAGWKERVLANLSGLLTIRRTGDIEGDGLEAVLARAEQALHAGDLGRAVGLLEKIEGPGVEAAGLWLRDAKARLGAAAAVRQLRRLAFSREENPAEGP